MARRRWEIAAAAVMVAAALVACTGSPPRSPEQATAPLAAVPTVSLGPPTPAETAGPDVAAARLATAFSIFEATISEASDRLKEQQGLRLTRAPEPYMLSPLALYCGKIANAHYDLIEALKAIRFPGEAQALAERVISREQAAHLNSLACRNAGDLIQWQRAWDLATAGARSAAMLADELRSDLGLPPGRTLELAAPSPSTAAPTATLDLPEPAPTPAASHLPSLAERQLRKERQPILDALTSLGYECGPERPDGGDVPQILCTFAGSRTNEGVVLYAAERDFRGVGLITYDRDRIRAFLLAIGSVAIADSMLQEIDAIGRIAAMPASRCPLPCEVTTSGPEFGELEGQVAVEIDQRLIVVLQEFGF